MPEIRLDLLEPVDLIEQKGTEEILVEIGQDAEIKNLSAADPGGRIARGWTVREQKRRVEEEQNAKGVMLAFAKGKKLDFIGETYYRNSDGSKILRKPGESDEAYRLALQESPEGLTSAGTLKSYNFHASRAHPLVDRDSVSSHSPETMVMNTYFIADDDKAAEVKQAIESYLIPFIPGGDKFTAIQATKKARALVATAKLDPGVGRELVEKQGRAALDQYRQKARRVHGVISQSSISEALTVPGVRQIIFDGWADIECSESEYPEISSVTLTYEVY